MPYTRNFTDDAIYRIRRNADPVTTSRKTFNGSRTGDRVYNWKEKIRSGLDATSAFTSDRARALERVDGECNLRYVQKLFPNGTVFEDRWTGIAQGPSIPNHLSISTTTVDNKALSKILQRIREETSHLNGLTVAAELRKTISMLKHPFRDLQKMVGTHLDKLERARRTIPGLNTAKGRKEWKRVISSTWLETQFGLRPLLKDTKDIAEAIGRLQDLPPKKVKVRARAFQGDSVSTTVVDAPQGIGEFVRFLKNQRQTTKYQVSYSVGLWLTQRSDENSLHRLRDVLGFTPENFFPTLWEVLPWSFLIDYAVNVGEIIEAQTTDTTAVKWISRTATWETTLSQENTLSLKEQAKILDDSGYTLRSLSGDHLGKVTIVRKTVSRTLPPSLGIPTLVLSLPDKESLKWLNVAALWAQRRKRVELI